jgi:hypothetical protein
MSRIMTQKKMLEFQQAFNLDKSPRFSRTMSNVDPISQPTIKVPGLNRMSTTPLTLPLEQSEVKAPNSYVGQMPVGEIIVIPDS